MWPELALLLEDRYTQLELYMIGLGDPTNEAEISFSEGCDVHYRIAAEFELYLPGGDPTLLLAFKVAHYASMPIAIMEAYLFGRF